MSFSTEVKKELATYYSSARHCDIAELAGIINTCGAVSNTSVKIQTENAIVAKKYFTLVKKTFNASCEISIKRSTQLKKARLYSIYLRDIQVLHKMLNVVGLLSSEGRYVEKNVQPLLVKRDCCKRAYIRGAFIAGGSISDPEKSYHLEFVHTDERIAIKLSQMINSFALNSKMIPRKSHFVVYLKEGEHIVDLLNIMSAHKALINLENLRIIKDMRNSVNRIVNCETANLNKTVTAAILQMEDIEFIYKTKGLDYLSEQLEEVARLRLLNPEASLKEIGMMLIPIVGKSGVNHRLRRISEIAENLRGGLL